MSVPGATLLRSDAAEADASAALAHPNGAECAVRLADADGTHVVAALHNVRVHATGSEAVAEGIEPIATALLVDEAKDLEVVMQAASGAALGKVVDR